MKCVSIHKISGNEVYYTIFLILLVKIMLCSKLGRQKSFKLKHISYTTRGDLGRGEREGVHGLAPGRRDKSTRKLLHTEGIFVVMFVARVSKEKHVTR